MDSTKELGAKEFEAALLLANGHSKVEVSRRLGVARRTLYNWLERPVFRTAVDRLVSEQAEEAKARLQRKSIALLDLALDADGVLPTRFTDRLAAARTGLLWADSSRMAGMSAGGGSVNAGGDAQIILTQVTAEELNTARARRGLPPDPRTINQEALKK